MSRLTESLTLYTWKILVPERLRSSLYFYTLPNILVNILVNTLVNILANALVDTLVDTLADAPVGTLANTI